MCSTANSVTTFENGHEWTKHSSFISTSATPIKVLAWLEVGEGEKKELNEKEECGKCGNEEQQGRHKGPPCVGRTDPIQDTQKNYCRESWTRAGHQSWATDTQPERGREGERGGVKDGWGYTGSILKTTLCHKVYMKSSHAKASKCHLKFSSLMMIFIKLVYLSSVISLK